MKCLLMLLILGSCNYKIDKQDVASSIQPTQETADSISYKQTKEEVFLPKCISCHGNGGGVNLETYSSAVAHLDDIRRATLQTKTMPKSPVSPLSTRQLEVLTAWIDAGGPENSPGHHSPDDDSDTGETPSGGFEAIKKKILENRCLNCHRRGEHAGNIPLETREDLLSSSINLVVPGKPEQSLIYTITAPGARNMMPPIGVEPLSKVQREMIRVWINNGAN